MVVRKALCEKKNVSISIQPTLDKMRVIKMPAVLKFNKEY